MQTRAGFQVVKGDTIEWEDRVNVDGWPCRAGMYYEDRENNLTLRLINYPVGSTEPRHVHGGTHATTVLKERAIIDGVTMKPLDIVLGPGGEPHGPLHYPEGCFLLSAFQGDYMHGEVAQLSDQKQYRLIQADTIPWQKADSGEYERKLLLDHGAGNLQIEALRFSPGAEMPSHSHPGVQAGLIVEGDAAIEGQALKAWDLVHVPSGAPHGPISFPSGATVLSLTLRTPY